MANGKFKIKGTKDFLVASVFCGFMCIWSIRDAWFPTEKVLKRHPLEFPVSFKTSGVVKEIHVKPKEEIKGKILLASLSDDAYRAKVTEAEAAFEAAKAAKDPAAEEKWAALMKAREELSLCSIYNTDYKVKTTHGEDVLHGVVERITAAPATHIDAGAAVMIIKPADTFYLFNKTLAVLMFIGTLVSLIFHRIASK
ncbi:MAG: hypothetical protein MUC65_06750 [Pontiellaceae bacterium]|jgi:hypothetical protein|nr:hypothetical protein [Pontiellaceae bacterium]